jgi:hypothetical protein
MKYFDKLPVISYNGFSVRNIMALATLSERTKSDKTAFYPYQMNDYDRVDALSHKYYDNSDYAWLVWMANGVVDPYYDMMINDSDFNKYIDNKYGSMEAAIEKILYFRSNWREDPTEINTVQFDMLPANSKKYFSPVLDVNLKVHSYKRKAKDLIASTNVIITIQLNSNAEFTIGEIIKTDTGEATVTFSEGSIVTCQHVTGTFESSQTVVGQTSKNTATIRVPQANEQSVTIVSRNSPLEEYTYWEPVNAYQYEYELNEDKRDIKLIDNRYKQTINNELKRVFG